MQNNAANLVKIFLQSHKHKLAASTSAFWLLLDQFARIFMGFIVSLSMARSFGPEVFGIWSFAIALISMLTSVAVFGLNNIVIRELNKYPDKQTKILGSALFLRVGFGMLAAVIAFVICIFSTSTTLTLAVVGTISIGMIFQSLEVIEYWFQSQLKTQYTVIARLIAYTLITVAKLFSMYIFPSLLVIAFLQLLESILIGFGFIYLSFKKNNKIRLWKVSYSETVQLMSFGFPLVISGILTAVIMKIGLILLGIFTTTYYVGIYGVAVSFSEVWYIFPIVLSTSVLPRLTQLYTSNPRLFDKNMGKLYLGAAVSAVTISILMYLVASPLITGLYGTDYSSSVLVLQVVTWASVFMFLSVISNIYLIISNKLGIIFYRTLTSAIVCLILNIILIPKMNAQGAAVATVASYMSLMTASFFWKDFREHFVRSIKASVL